MLAFMYKIKVKECLDKLEQLKQERNYEEFVKKTNDTIKMWNRVLK
jgi:hypothetical protein